MLFLQYMHVPARGKNKPLFKTPFSASFKRPIYVFNMNRCCDE